LLEEELSTTKDTLSEAQDENLLLNANVAELEEKLLKIPILETVIENCNDEIKALTVNVENLE
jgi:hypothetical protein